MQGLIHLASLRDYLWPKVHTLRTLNLDRPRLPMSNPYQFAKKPLD